MDSVVSAVNALGLDPVYIFLVAVVLDILAGVVQAVRTKTFDFHKLPSFLRSQLGTREFLVVAAAALAAMNTGGNAHSAALSVVSLGGFGMTLALAKDIFDKIRTIVTGK